MRPLYLELEGFTCYRERQRLDLASLGVFAITGPTGAGKSTLLDAMIFALFGVVPRLGRRGAGEVISSGRAEAQVRLDFALGRRRFSIVRGARRKGGAEVRLDALTDAAPAPIATGPHAVDEALGSLLGLDYETFTQSVILPQNEFSSFLQGDPQEQRKIVRRLLRLDLYERMRDVAGARAGRLSERVRALEEQLAPRSEEGTFADAAELEEEALRSAQEAEALGAELERLSQRAEELLGILRHAARVEAARARVVALEEKGATEIAAARELLRLARAGAAVEALALDAERKAAVSAEASRLLDAARARGAFLGEAKDEAAGALLRAKEAAREGPLLEARARAIAEVLPRLALLARERERASRIAEEVERQDDMAARFRASLAALEASRALEEQERGELTAVIEALPAERLSPEAQKAARACCDRRAKLLEIDMNAGRAHSERARGETEAQEALEAAKKVEAEAEASSRAVEAELIAAKLRVEATERLRLIASLRAELHPGETCPVCTQAVKGALPLLPSPPVEGEKVRALSLAAERARRLLKKAIEGRAAAEARRDAAREARLAAAQEASRAKVARAQVDEELGRMAAGLGLSDGVALAGVLDAAEAHLGEAQRGRARLEALTSELERGRREAERLTEGLLSTDRSRAAWRRELEELEGTIEGLEGELAPFLASKDTQQTLLARLEGLRREVEEAEARLAAKEAEVSRAALEQAALGAKATAAHLASEELRAKLEDTLAAEGFATIAEARAAQRSPEVLVELDARVERHQVLLASAGQELEQLQQTAPEAVATEAELLATRSALGAAQEARDAAIRHQAACAHRRAALEAELEARRRIEGELTQLRSEARLYTELSTELRGDRFQDHVLVGIFEGLVRGASRRMEEMTARYSLRFDGRRFLVVDHDHAGELRPAETLSGGEIFIASLALAMELSAKVSTRGGGVPLESLFIDEGFGSLDPDALETVALAIETQEAGGRMIGVVTHVPELAARLPARIEVEKRLDGSIARLLVD